jgi:hypothetical protein
VLVHDRDGTRREDSFFTTEAGMSVAEMNSHDTRRSNVETTS